MQRGGQAPRPQVNPGRFQPYSRAPTQPYTTAPTQSYTTAPTQPYTTAPTQSYTRAPTQPYQGAPTQSYTRAPTQPYQGAPSQPYPMGYTQPYPGAPTQPLPSHQPYGAKPASTQPQSPGGSAPAPQPSGRGEGRAREERAARSRGLRVLTGRVAKVREWMEVGLPCPVLYRVHATLATEVEADPAARGASKTCRFEVCGEDGQRLKCVFVEIDREMAAVRRGERVVVVGRAVGGTIQVVTVEAPEETSERCLARLENFAVRGVRLALAQAKEEGGRA